MTYLYYRCYNSSEVFVSSPPDSAHDEAPKFMSILVGRGISVNPFDIGTNIDRAHLTVTAL